MGGAIRAENTEGCGVKTTRRKHFKTGSCAEDITANNLLVNMVDGDIRVMKERSFASVARLCRHDLSCLDRDRLSLGTWLQASCFPSMDLSLMDLKTA